MARNRTGRRHIYPRHTARVGWHARTLRAASGTLQPAETSEDASLQAEHSTLAASPTASHGTALAPKARVEQPKARVIAHQAREATATQAQTRLAARSRQARKKQIHNGRPLFVLSTAKRRRARYGVKRGGYYSLPSVSRPSRLPRVFGWLLALLGVFWTSVFALLLVGGFSLYVGYLYIAKDLPSVDDIHGVQFQTTRIYDRYGNLLYEMYDPNEGKRTYITYDKLPKSLINATIAVEDRSFEENNGVDLQAIARAVYINLTNKGSSGASTITQQLVRQVLLPEKDEHTLTRKLREAILAVQFTQKYSKEKTLEIYLNEISYGSLSYGVAAAADTYFGKQVSDLTLGESAMLAGLPQAPGDYDPNVNFEAARARQKIVLGLMVKAGYITQAEMDKAYAEDVHPVVRAANVPRNAPHFVEYVRHVLEQEYGTDVAEGGGLKVFTTIDLNWQAEAQRIAAAQIDNIKRQGASNAGLVAVNPRTGEILAMVGSVDYTDPRFGQFNVATALRQPGSSFKPFTYATAFEQGYNQDSILPDLPAQFTNGAGLLPYVPQNYDMRFHGPVSVRSALANSFNIPAVEMLNTVGVPAVLDTAHRMGITTLNDPSRYGLALTLGGGEVTLLDMTSAFGTFADYGTHVPATPFLKIVDAKGNVLYDLDRAHPRGQQQAIDPAVAYQISNILSDNGARTPMFGPNSALKIDGINAAAKTGTTNDWKDSWTMGYTPALAVGVWVGNNDGQPMSHVAGAIGAAPIWHDFIQKVYDTPELKALLYKPGEKDLPSAFVPPPGMVRAPVCASSGMAPGPACVDVRYEWFAPENVPTEVDTWHKWVPVTLHDGGKSIAGPGTPKSDTIERIFTFPPDQYKGWIGGGPPGVTYVLTQTTQAAALPTPLKSEPTSIAAYVTAVPGINGGLPAESRAGSAQQIAAANANPIPNLRLSIASPVQEELLSGIVHVTGDVGADTFASYSLEWIFGNGENGAVTISNSTTAPADGQLGTWDTTGLQAGPYTLRLTMETTDGEVVRTSVPVRVGTADPSVTITSPSDGSIVYNGEAVTIDVSADGGGAPVAGVEIYADGKRIASLLSPPWTASWAVITGTHEFNAILYTVPGERVQSPTVRVTSGGLRPTPSPTRALVLWISNLTLYKEVPAGVNDVWVDVAPNSPVKHVDIYVDGYPAGFATGPGYRVNPAWTATPTTPPSPVATSTLPPDVEGTMVVLQATADAKASATARVAATRAARATNTAISAAATATTQAANQAATATSMAATESPTPAPPTDTPLPSPTPTFVRYQPLPDPMLGDYVARCIFTTGRHRITAIGYDQDNNEVGRDESWVIVK